MHAWYRDDVFHTLTRMCTRFMNSPPCQGEQNQDRGNRFLNSKQFNALPILHYTVIIDGRRYTRARLIFSPSRAVLGHGRCVLSECIIYRPVTLKWPFSIHYSAVYECCIAFPGPGECAYKTAAAAAKYC